MKKNNQRKPRPKLPLGVRVTPDVAPAARSTVHSDDHDSEQLRTQLLAGRKVGVVSGTPADTLDEVSEHGHGNKWVAIFISVLAVILAVAVMGGANATKTAQQAGFNVVDTFAFYQAKMIRQGQLKLAVEQLRLKSAEGTTAAPLPENVRTIIAANTAAYEAESQRLETDGRNGKKELLAKAENCENERKVALAKDPFFDYSMALIQIAIVLASASIVAGARMLLVASGIGAVLGVIFLINGFALLYGAPDVNTKRADELKKAGVTMVLKCIDD